MAVCGKKKTVFFVEMYNVYNAIFSFKTFVCINKKEGNLSKAVNMHFYLLNVYSRYFIVSQN